jgi:Na+-translocating ferredoxin:NAD+ oxidoreductase RnfG subunit
MTKDQIKKMKDQIRKRDLVKVLYKALLHEKIKKKKIKKLEEKVKAYIRKNLGKKSKAYIRSLIEILIIFELILFEEKG